MSQTSYPRSCLRNSFLNFIIFQQSNKSIWNASWIVVSESFVQTSSQNPIERKTISIPHLCSNYKSWEFAVLTHSLQQRWFLLKLMSGPIFVRCIEKVFRFEIAFELQPLLSCRTHKLERNVRLSTRLTTVLCHWKAYNLLKWKSFFLKHSSHLLSSSFFKTGKRECCLLYTSDAADVYSV